MLASVYRFTVQNLSGQTLAANAVKVYATRWKFSSTGELEYESSPTTVLNNGSTISNSAFFSSSTITNSSLYIGGDFVFEVNSPSSTNGDVVLYYDRSTDGGTTWTTDWHGTFVCGVFVNSAGIRRKGFSL